MVDIMMDERRALRNIRIRLVLFLLGIVFGLHTVVFVEIETELLAKYGGRDTFIEERWPSLSAWIEQLKVAVSDTYSSYPVIAYCMDWLSYACVVFGVLLLGAIRDPVRNVWVVKVFMFACFLGILLPFVAGSIRGVPMFWRVSTAVLELSVCCC